MFSIFFRFIINIILGIHSQLSRSRQSPWRSVPLFWFSWRWWIEKLALFILSGLCWLPLLHFTNGIREHRNVSLHFNPPLSSSLSCSLPLSLCWELFVHFTRTLACTRTHVSACGRVGNWLARSKQTQTMSFYTVWLSGQCEMWDYGAKLLGYPCYCLRFSA